MKKIWVANMVQSSDPKARNMPALTMIRRPTEIHERTKKVMLTARVARLPTVIMVTVWMSTST